MHVLILGAAGMVGRKLVERLATEGHLGGRAIARVTLHDVVEPQAPAGAPFAVAAATSEISRPGEADRLVAERPDVIFHLAAIVSGEAEADFDKGYRVNLDGTRDLFEAVRRIGDGYRPRLVFTSSIAVFGAPFPDGIRLPTICVRPGRPNKAASGFFSGIIREPLAGEEAVLPVGEEVRHWHASPRSATGFLLHAATLPGERIGPRRNLTMPGLSVTVAEQIEALRKVAGERVVARIRREPDPGIQAMVAG